MGTELPAMQRFQLGGCGQHSQPGLGAGGWRLGAGGEEGLASGPGNSSAGLGRGDQVCRAEGQVWGAHRR